jgi:DNA-binding NtrC family response regulator
MKQHILVVDDEGAVRDLLEAFFRKNGYDVTKAGGTRETLALLEEVTFNLVLLDVLLGDESDGMDLLGRIKDMFPKLPVIIMTGLGLDEELLQEALQKGASGYVSKTLPLDQLLMEVHRTLRVSG